MNKAKITASAPILLVEDVINSANWYKDKLGFEIEGFYGDPVSFSMIYRDNYCIMLSQAPKDKIVPHWKVVDKMWNVYFWTDDVEKLYQEFNSSGAAIDYELHVKPYNVKEFGINDPDGYDIAFGEIIKENK